MEHESDGDTNRWRTWNRHQRIGKSTGSLRNQRIIREHQDYSITKISLNAEKSLRDLRYLSVKNHELMLVWKTYIIMIKKVVFKPKEKRIVPIYG